jgi:hypothetical protein
MGRKARPAKARLSVGSIFDGTVDYHRALRILWAIRKFLLGVYGEMAMMIREFFLTSRADDNEPLSNPRCFQLE